MNKTVVKRINSREFYRSPTRVARLIEEGEKIIVTKNGQDFFKVVPKFKKKKHTLKMGDFSDLIVQNSKEKDLSKRVDDIAYNIDF